GGWARGAEEGGGDDRQQRRSRRIVLREAERDERGHEQDPPADAEQSRQHSGCETEHDCERIRHLTKSQPERESRSAAKSSSIVRVRSRCCSAVAKPTGAAAGTPTSAA